MTTYHGFVRTQERTGYNEDKANRYIKNALMKGKLSCECTGKLKKYLAHKSTNNTVAMAYDGFCFIVNADRELITMYKIPEEISKKTYYSGKEQIQNTRKYYNLNREYYYDSYYDELEFQ